jgi:translocation and assembly module TamB
MPEERIGFSGKKIVLNNFKVLDSLNNKLQINGSVDFTDRKSVLSDLDILTSDLQIMNKNEEKNSSFYGKIFTDSHLTVKGPVASPVLKGKIVLTGGTDIYFRQMENLNLSESEQVLTFVSNNSASVKEDLKTAPKSTIYNKTSIESVVEIDPATRINIILSKRMFNIDLMIQGGGEVNYNMLDNNQVNLTGKYEVSDGSANLKMIGWPNKSFKISRGGFIKWNGKLEDPELQFEALSKVRSSYTNPVDEKQRDVEFNVLLKLSNRLSALDVLFTINTADQYLMSIINTLSPQEQMRQAITILLFEKIDLPGISTSSSYMSEQVNQIIASQLNQLTKTTIKGIDISFGLDTYIQSPSTGSQQTKTSLSYDVRKSLLHDRAQIEISGRVNDYTNTQSSSNLSLNNFSFKYQLDSSANKFIKVYNERSYEDVFEGEVIKTGVGFIYRKNYRVLSDIWKKEKKSKKSKDQKK